MRIKALDRRRLHEVERLALGDAFGDVEQHHVAELFETNEMRERAADLAGADQCNLWACHAGEEPWIGNGGSPVKSVIDRFRPAVQAARRTP